STQVLKLARSIADRGLAVVVISHILPHVMELADRIVVMRHGRKVAELTEDVSSERLVRLILGIDAEDGVGPGDAECTGSAPDARGGDVTNFRAGGARLSLDPPLGLPMVGFIRQPYPALGYGDWPLETSALALEAGDTRVVICGVDIVGIGEPQISELI